MDWELEYQRVCYRSQLRQKLTMLKHAEKMSFKLLSSTNCSNEVRQHQLMRKRAGQECVGGLQGGKHG